MTELTMELLKLIENQIDDVLEEDAGNLKGLPAAWVKTLTSIKNGIGGKDSPVEDLATPVKNVSKFRTTIIDSMKRDELVGIYIKVEDEPFALIYKGQNWTGSKAEYSIVSVDSEKSKIQKSNVIHRRETVRDTYSKKGYRTVSRRQLSYYEQTGMPMSTLLPRLQGSIASAYKEEDEKLDVAFDNIFKNLKIDIYAVGADKNRMKTHKDREENRKGSVSQSVDRKTGAPVNATDRTTMEKVLSAADKKYLKSKAIQVSKKLQDEIAESLDKIKADIVSIIDEAADGKSPSSKNFDTNIKELKDKISAVSSLAYTISSCIKRDGSAELIRRWGAVPQKTWDFERLIKTLKDAKGGE